MNIQTNVQLYLKSHFKKTLTEHLGERQITDKQINTWWQSLKNHYNEPHRHYHTLTHINKMFSYFEQLKSNRQFNNPMVVALAIYYHDVIYDATKLDNEKQSAKLFENTFDGFLDKGLVDRVVRLIIFTETHQLDNSNNGNNDIKLFLDMDLSVLGQPWAVYEMYAHNIRKEYFHVPEADYRQGRKSVLEKFLKRPRLYFSDEFYCEYEEPARGNLKKEIMLLS